MQNSSIGHLSDEKKTVLIMIIMKNDNNTLIEGNSGSTIQMLRPFRLCIVPGPLRSSSRHRRFTTERALRRCAARE